MKNLYLSLAVLGAVGPYVFFFQFVQAEGIDLPLFIQSLFINGAAAGFSLDLLISSLVFWLFMGSEYKSGRGPHPWLFVVLNLTIGLSCALPAYLYVREKAKIAAQLQTA